MNEYLTLLQFLFDMTEEQSEVAIACATEYNPP